MIVFTFYILVAIYILVYLCILFYVSGIHFLNAGDSVQSNNPGLKTYCHNATSKYLTYMWRTMTVRVLRMTYIHIKKFLYIYDINF